MALGDAANYILLKLARPQLVAHGPARAPDSKRLMTRLTTG